MLDASPPPPKAPSWLGLYLAWNVALSADPTVQGPTATPGQETLPSPPPPDSPQPLEGGNLRFLTPSPVPLPTQLVAM